MSELRAALESLYGDDPRFEAQWTALREAMDVPPPRARPRCAASTPSGPADWLQREDAIGYVTYVDRFAGTLRRRARAPARTCASSASPTCT